MELQHIFTPQYVNYLENNIEVSKYYDVQFTFDSSQVKKLNGIEKPRNLEAKLLEAEDLFKEAILLYEAFENLPPMFAATKVLWTYLTHVDLLQYVRKRWPEYQYFLKGAKKGTRKSEEESRNYIRQHWFYSSNGIMRTSLMGLWWSVFLTLQKNEADGTNDYTLTKVFFSNDGLRTRRLGTGYLGRNKEALYGILSFINNNKELFGLDENLKPILNQSEDSASGLENRMIWITRHFNLIGGAKPLGCQSREFFYRELDRYKDHLRKIKRREDVQGPNVFV